jgi:DNA helicase II / ATP-dependent DNA helicase PcrA
MELIKDLNPQQIEAVMTDKPYVRIIAGAGSGKTRVLTHRLVFLVQERQCAPEQLLAITFTNKVAKEMLSRANQLLPQLHTRLNIMTYHSFAARFLRKEIHHLGYPRHFTILDDEDQEKIIKNIAEEQGFRRSDAIVSLAQHFISEQKSQGIPPKSIQIEYERYPQEKLCLTFYELYEAKLKQMSNLDFDDLLIKTIDILTHYPDVRASWQHRFQHILIDEFQDTNDLQYELLNLILDDHTHLYVVGDPDQTIYSWRGANPKIILGLDQKFPLQTIILSQNYRSTKPILDVSNRLISMNQHRVAKDLFTEQVGGDPVMHQRFFNRDEEARWVVQQIYQRLQHGEYASDCAILYRANYLTLPLEKELTRRQIPFRIFGGMRFYQRQEIKDVLAYFKLLINSQDDLSFERIINVPRRGIGEVSLQQLKSMAQARQLSLYDASGQLGMYAEASPKLKAQLKPLMETFFHFKPRFETDGLSLRQEAEAFLQQLGYLDSLRQDEEGDRLDNVYTLLDDLEEFMRNNLEQGFGQYLENISLMSSQDEMVTEQYVSLMTVHTAKGLEFKHVYVIGLNEGVFPSTRTLEDDAYLGLEEERRLCYVAMTRAMKTLTLTCASDYSFVIQSNLVPSRFFKEAGLTFQNIYGLSKQHQMHHSSTQSDRLGAVHQLETPIVEPKANKEMITWQVGDRLVHETFGEGLIKTIVSSEIIEVFFSGLQTHKKLVAQHPKIKKVS